MSFADIMNQAFNADKDPVSDEAILKAYYDEVLMGDDSEVDSEIDSDIDDASEMDTIDEEKTETGETSGEKEDAGEETDDRNEADVGEGADEIGDDGADEIEDEGADESDDEGEDMPIFYPIPSIERITRFVLLQYRKANVRYFIEEVRATVRLIRLVYHADPTDVECRETSELVREVWSGN